MKKFFRLLTKAFMALFALLLLLFVVVVIYVSLNKKEIIGQVTAEIGDKLNGKVEIKDVELSFFRNFPEVSVLLKNVSVTDSMFATHQHPLLLANEVFVNISLLKLIKQEPPLKGVRVQDGTVYLYTDSTGYTNAYLLKTKKDSSASITGKPQVKNELKSVLLKDMHILINDLKKEKLHDLQVNRLDLKMEDRDSLAFLFGVKADIEVNSLAFNLPRGSFLKNKSFAGKFDMRFNKQSGQLIFDSINVKIAGHPFNVSGSFDLKGDAPQFALQIHTRNVLYPFVRTLLPGKLDSNLAIVQVDMPVIGDAVVTGPLRGGEPKIYITWSARNAQVKTPFLDFENASFDGYYTNEVKPGLPRKDPNSKIEINHFSAEWHNLKLTSNRIEILDLYTPTLTCDLGSRFELTALNEIIGSEAIRFKEGTGAIQIMYKGPIEKNNNTNSHINGAMSFSNALLLYAPRNVEMQKLNGKLTFRNSDLFVENLQCVVLDNQITMHGEAKNLLTLVNTEPGKASIDWKIYTPSLNLNSFVYLLQSRTNKKATVKNKNGVADMAVKIDNLLEQCKLQVNLQADKLIYKKFVASGTVANITLLEDRYLINKVSMDHAGGHLDLTGSLRNRTNNYHEALINASLKQVDVSKIFLAFDNFGQDGITSESLEGKLSANVNASMGLDDAGTIIPSSIVSRVDFSLADGALNNYEPLKKLQRFVFKKRDFDNIRFAELKNTLEINKGEIKINRMEIQSSVLSLFVEGIYAQTGGKTDMSIQVPLNNLKKREADYNPENIGTEAKTGGSIFIRGRPGEDGNIKFKLDLFNKYNKEKNAPEKSGIPE